jgi:hypothetical protein
MPGIIDRILGKPVEQAINAAGAIIDDAVTNDEERLEKKRQMAEILNSLAATVATASRDVVITEMQGTRLQRNWRPILMLAFGAIVTYRYFLAPVFGWPLPDPDIPEQFWNLLEIGLGGYVIGRSAEKIVGHLAENMDKIPGRKK